MGHESHCHLYQPGAGAPKRSQQRFRAVHGGIEGIEGDAHGGHAWHRQVTQFDSSADKIEAFNARARPPTSKRSPEFWRKPGG